MPDIKKIITDSGIEIKPVYTASETPSNVDDQPGKYEEPFLKHEVSLKNKPAIEKPAFPLEPNV